ncbi:cyclic AMP response element-binding protein A [Toxorhynchites rutilus septentrionalis]|uniref:cyclic AMP response element-binding protein A n=1 Tax=Toxorhynchites rutilus septentrionalis TaxID=329112 RepID=UPI002478D4E6|nr:cyclic AMP response element-binding protein A [Toxorhynchites rutilus septentrionalis]
MDFDDGDLKELWDTDLDTTMQDTLKMSSYVDMQDWMERDSKLPPVILNDKLMTDAIIGSGMPIKTEHSYSLNSDGDSISDTLPDSPHSLQNKMDDIEEECYPAISMNTSANGQSKQHIIHRFQPNIPALLSAASNSVLTTFGGHNVSALKSTASGGASLNLLSALQQSSSSLAQQTQLVLCNPVGLNNNHLTVNNNLSKEISNSSSSTNSLLLSSGYSSKQSCSNESSSSSSGSIASDIEIDEMTVKEEPISPSSSCPPSPSGAGTSGTVVNGYTISTVNLANMAAYAQPDLVLEHKNGTLQLTSASQSLLKNQQIIINGNTISTTSGSSSASTPSQPASAPPKIVMSKLNIKLEPQSSSSFGLPPTPPSSLPSDESEGNQSPEHHTSPLSPPTVISAASPSTSSSSSVSSSSSGGSTPSSRRTSVNNGANGAPGTPTSMITSSPGVSRTVASQSVTTRQPIHTPLISTQPKGSTGTLILTEEEKRTLLAEGYPIPTRLPLTKAEEKSLKKIRRKIKNKISAQESRRKKKEYMDQLERRVEILVSENLDYRKRVESLEDSNQNLMTELAKLRTLISRQQSVRKM